MRTILLTGIVIGGLFYVYYLVKPGINHKAFARYAMPKNSVQYCAQYSIDECPPSCTIRPTCGICDDYACRPTPNYPQN